MNFLGSTLVPSCRITHLFISPEFSISDGYFGPLSVRSRILWPNWKEIFFLSFFLFLVLEFSQDTAISHYSQLIVRTPKWSTFYSALTTQLDCFPIFWILHVRRGHRQMRTCLERMIRLMSGLYNQPHIIWKMNYQSIFNLEKTIALCANDLPGV